MQNVIILSALLINLLLSHCRYPILPEMDREFVIADREAGKIAGFLQTMVEQGKLSEFHSQLIQMERDEVYYEAGYWSEQSGFGPAPRGEDGTAAVKLGNQRERQKLADLRPDLVDALTKTIEYRKPFPEPRMNAILEKPGVALAELNGLFAYIEKRRYAGDIKQDVVYEIYDIADTILTDAGISSDHMDNTSDKLVLVKAKQAMEAKLLEHHPEMADDVRNLRSGRKI